jgi:cell division protein FtsL
MGRNVIRRSNEVRVQQVWKVLAGLAVLTGFGLVFVFLQVRNVRLADEVKDLEVKLTELTKRNTALRLEVEHRMKPRSLQEKIQEFELRLISIAELPKVKAPLAFCQSSYEAYAFRKEERE